MNKIEKCIGLFLLTGILISASFVCIGGILFLIQHGSETIRTDILPSPLSRQAMWQLAFSFSPLGMIELGLLLLVLTQLLRVALLCGFYAAIRDYWFTGISAFILLVMVYSVLA